jgi:CRP-like cAMP-binding protein
MNSSDDPSSGEIALLMNSPRTATVEATKPCLCVSLSRQTFMTILDKHPEMRRQITEMAQARFTQLG